MKFRLTAIALGIGLTCASLPIFAQTATITVTGVGNDGLIEQVDSPNASASITQVGNYNKVGAASAGAGSPTLPGILQRSSHANTSVEQNGDQNTAAVTQINTGGSATIRQTSVSGATEGNTADVTQTTFSPFVGGNGVAVIEQNGLNKANVIQGLWGGRATINQEGGLSAKNIASIEQSSFGESATVDQSGDNLRASILQFNSDGIRTNITQTGANHTANVRQGGSMRTFVRIDQTGGFAIGNTVTVEQGFFTFMQATVNQAGDFLRAEIRQLDGSVKFATVNQSGYDQHASVNQLGYNGNAAGGGASTLINQAGRENDVCVMQNSTGGKEVEITQLGTGSERNVLTIVQNSTLQINSYDTAIAKQNGAGNTGNITQSGDWNLAELDQAGNGNNATIIQNGTGISRDTQNHAWITQTGNQYVASITQNGMSNRSGIFQH